MNLAELRELNQEELRQQLNQLRRELFDLRGARAAGKLDKPHRLQSARRQIARIETMVREKQPVAARGRVVSPPPAAATVEKKG